MAKKAHTAEDTAQRIYRRENALRPNRFLGYNHNALAIYLLERGAYPVAESELRRAVWLNPYEPVFLANLAWCLHKQQRYEEAGEYLKQAIEQAPGNIQVHQIIALMEPAADRLRAITDETQD